MKKPELFANLLAWSLLDIILICFADPFTLFLGVILLFILIINWRNYLNTNYK